jgi:alanine dehydrogenase
MHIGLPTETKDGEFRVALTPEAARSLASAGHTVTVQAGAGSGAGFADDEYAAAGARLGDPWAAALIVKVKELQPSERGRAQAGHTVFAFHHFGPDRAQLEAALASRATYVAFETVGEADRSLPILAPMSAIAGRLAVQAGAWFLQKPNGGSGVLLPGVADVPGARVLIVGAGNVGSNALAVASGMGAQVRVFDRSTRRFAELQARYPRARFDSDPALLCDAVAEADLVIGAVLVPGGLAPKVLTRAMLVRMRRGSVLVDVAIDQGGCAETSRPTRHSAPTYVEEGVVHYCVPNMPSACARTASLALSAAALPWVLELAAGQVSPALRTGFQVRAGSILHPQLARDTGLPCAPW